MARWDDDEDAQFELVVPDHEEPAETGRAYTPCEEYGHDYGSGQNGTQCLTCGKSRDES